MAIEDEEELKAPSAIVEEEEYHIDPEKEEEERATTKARASREEEEEEEHGVEKLQNHYLRSIDVTLVTRQLPSQGLSFQLWPAATTLVGLLDLHNSPISSFLDRRPDLRILELGSGTGLVGISAAAVLGATVTLSDLPHVLPNLRFNAALNSSAIGSRGGSVDVAALRWGEAEDVKNLGREFDIILGSDLVYHDHLFEPLLRTLCWLFVREGESVVFLMAHLRRWKKDSVFFKKARKYFQVQKIHEDPPLPGSRIGVAVYSFAGKGAKNVKRSLMG